MEAERLVTAPLTCGAGGARLQMSRCCRRCTGEEVSWAALCPRDAVHLPVVEDLAQEAEVETHFLDPLEFQGLGQLAELQEDLLMRGVGVIVRGGVRNAQGGAHRVQALHVCQGVLDGNVANPETRRKIMRYSMRDKQSIPV